MSTDSPSPGNKLPETGVKMTEIYKEQYAHFRGMNDILYKIPPLFTAVPSRQSSSYYGWPPLFRSWVSYIPSTSEVGQS
jgi:hypothetical protein